MQSEERLGFVEVKTGVGGRFGRLERTQKWEFRRVLMKESGGAGPTRGHLWWFLV